MKTRSALGIQKDVIFAIFLRDLRERFSGYALGNVWLILEPLLLISLFIVLLGVRGRGELGYAEPAVFLLAGLVAFRQLWQPTMKQVMSSLPAFRGLRMFRQISVFDLMIARAFMQAGIYLVVITTLTVGFKWLGFDAWPHNLLMVLSGSLVVWLLGIGIGMVFATSYYFGNKELEKLVSLIQFPLLILSAVIYPMTLIPEPYRTWLSYNPLVHASEWHREYWIELYHSPVLDEWYLMMWMLGSLALGVAAIRLTRHRPLP